MPSLIAQATIFAIDSHGDQVRKYTGEPYWKHPMRVAEWLLAVGAPWGGLWDDEVIAAAWLHDVVEDTPVTNDQIKVLFGAKVAQLVAEVTNPSKLIDGSREFRKNLDREFLAGASPEGKSIKLADLLDNTPSIVEYGKDFAKIYVGEMRALLPFLQDTGHPLLFSKAYKIINP